MDLIEAICGAHKARPVAGLPDGWEWQLGDRPRFMAIVTVGGDALLETTSFGQHDADLLLQVLRFAREHEEEVTQAVPLAVVGGFKHPGYGFDVIVSAAPPVHRLNAAASPDLHNRTYAVYPAYKCEFSGREDVAEAQERWNRIVPLTQFGRQPAPALKAWYSLDGDVVDTSRLDAFYPRLETLPALMDRLQDGGFVEFENFAGERCRVLNQSGTLRLDRSGDGDSAQTQTSKDLASAIAKFTLAS